MGLFDRLLGRAARVETRVWSTTSRKLDDVAGAARSDTLEGRVSILVHHFADTAAALDEALSVVGVPCRKLRNPTDRDLAELTAIVANGEVAMVPADELTAWHAAGVARPAGPGPGARLHLVERFPIRARDDRVLALREILPAPVEAAVYVALDEPWLAGRFDEKGGTLIDRLGVGDDEALCHPMIDGALRRVQNQLESRLRSMEQPARNCEEWMLANLKMEAR